MGKNEIRFLKWSLKVITMMEIGKMEDLSNAILYIDSTFQVFLTYLELPTSIKEMIIDDEMQLLKLTENICDLIILLSQNYKHLEILIEKCIVWRIISLITYFREDVEALP